jgi:hypothetical protein
MQDNIALLLSIGLLLSCSNHDGNVNVEPSTETTADIETDSLEIQRQQFYGKDTLLLDEFQTPEGHLIKLRGSQSHDLYQIDVMTASGQLKSFETAEYAYGASHSSIKWINDNYIFVRQGCGTSCWTGLALSLSDDRGIIEIMLPFYSDSISEIVIAPDKELEYLEVINLNSDDKQKLDIKICKGATGILYHVKSVERKGDNKYQIRYEDEDEDCNEATEEIEIKN